MRANPFVIFLLCVYKPYAPKRVLIKSFILLTHCVPFMLSGAINFVKPKLWAVLTLCFSLLTGLISPARLISPAITHDSGHAKSVLAEYKAAATAESIALSVKRTPPETFTNKSY